MLQFQSSPALFRLCGVGLLIAQLFLFVFALKPFHYGTWYQVEPTNLALYGMAALNGVWLAAGLAAGWLRVVRPVHPVTLLWLLFLLWQYVATVFSQQPLRSWFGHPAIGEGTAYYTGMVLSFLLAQALWNSPRYQRMLLGAGALAIAIMAWLHFEPKTLCEVAALDGPAEHMAAGNWADYLAFLLAYLWIAFAAAPSVRSPRLYILAGIAFFAIVAYVAESMAATLLFYPAFIGGGALLWLSLRRLRWAAPMRGWRVAAMVACLGPALWVAISMQSFWAGLNGCSLPTRALFNQASVAAIADEPTRLIMGHGWGRYADDLFRYGLLEGIQAFEDGQRKPNWRQVDGTSNHSHNELMETLLALGLPGMLLWLAIPMAALWHLPRVRFWWCAPMLLAIHSFQGFWFFLPQVMGFQALCWAALAARAPHPASPLKHQRLIALVALAAAGLMAASLPAHWQGMEYGQRLSTYLRGGESLPAAYITEDLGRGGDRFHAGALYYGEQMMQRSASGTVTAEDAVRYGQLMEAAQAMARQPESGAWLASTDMWLKNFLFMNAYDTPLNSLKPAAKAALIPSVLTLTAKAPAREDATALVLFSLDAFNGGDRAQAIDILQQILAIAPDQRAALWVRGRLMLADPATRQNGWSMLIRAKQLGVGRVFPVTDDELSRLP